MQSSSPDNASCSFALSNDTATYSHTAVEDQPWFLLDLHKPYWIDSVRLWNRPGYQVSPHMVACVVDSTTGCGTGPAV